MQRFETIALQPENTQPAQWRRSKDEPRREIPLSDAFDIAAEKLAEIIIMHGAHAVGFYLCKTLPVDAIKAFDQLARTLIQTRNVVPSHKQPCTLFDAALNGEVKVLWIAGNARKRSSTQRQKMLDALGTAPLVIVQDYCVVNDITSNADLLLPTMRPKQPHTLDLAHARPACEIGRRLAERIRPEQMGDFPPPGQRVN